MGKLDEILQKLIKEQTTKEKMITWLVQKKIAEQGIILTETQVSDLQQNIKSQLEDRDRDPSEKVDSLTIEIKDELNIELSPIEFSSKDYRNLQATFRKGIKATITSLIDSASDFYISDWAKEANQAIRKEQNYAKRFNKKIDQVWGNALYQFEVLLSKSTHIGQTYNNQKRENAAKNNDFIFDALIRLHARGCQVAGEILVLLKNGLADGALGRWRTLHEIVVIASFIANKKDNDVAERYLFHSVVDEYREMSTHQTHYKAIGQKRIPKKIFQQKESLYQSLLAKYGNNYGGHYGWAATTVGKTNPQMADIEKGAKLDYWKPFVQISNSSVHAISGGMMNQLGLPPNRQVMLAGASMYGLDYPGERAAHSLAILNTVLLTKEPELDNLAILNASKALLGEVYKAFAEVGEYTTQ